MFGNFYNKKFRKYRTKNNGNQNTHEVQFQFLKYERKNYGQEMD